MMMPPGNTDSERSKHFAHNNLLLKSKTPLYQEKTIPSEDIFEMDLKKQLKQYEKGLLQRIMVVDTFSIEKILFSLLFLSDSFEKNQALCQ
jgi:hypothetical protein